MRANLDATGGIIYAERAVMLLAPALGRDRTQQLVTEAVAASRGSGVAVRIGAAAATQGETRSAAGDLSRRPRSQPERYLGAAEALQDPAARRSTEE